MAVRTIIIGAGRWAQIMLKNAIDSDGVEVVCIASRSPQKSFLSGIRWVTMEELEKADFDAAIIAVPIDQLSCVARKMLQNGKHVLLEKPGAQSSEELISLYELARKKDLTLTINYHRGLDKDSSKIADFCRKLKAPKKFKIHHQWTKQKTRGNIVDNLLCHDISKTISLLRSISISERITVSDINAQNTKGPHADVLTLSMKICGIFFGDSDSKDVEYTAHITLIKKDTENINKYMTSYFIDDCKINYQGGVDSTNTVAIMIDNFSSEIQSKSLTDPIVPIITRQFLDQIKEAL